MKRIVVYTRAWRSGTGLYAQGLVEGLAAAGSDVLFIAPAGYPEDRTARLGNVRRVRPVRELVGGGSRLHRAFLSLARVAGGLGALLAARFTSDRFIVSIPDPFVFAIWPLMLLRLTGAKVVFVCHDPEPHSWSLPPRWRWLERAGYRLIYGCASVIAVLSEAGRAPLIQLFGVPAGKIVVAPHGAFNVPAAGPVPGSNTLLAFGTIRRNKQVALAMEAVIAARDAGCPVRMIVAGAKDPNDPAYLDECQAIAARCPDGLTLETGFITDERVNELLTACDALLMPYTDFNSQSGVAVLAGMAGRPVIAAPAGGIADLIAAGLAAVEIPQPVELDGVTESILAFYAKPAAEWSDRAARGRVLLNQTLAWPRIGRQLAGLFD
ncbi:glycosyltransferase family 4 protein [Caulobacter sp. UNC279MFTsu5.1]|uniref:glycosyltransferase family 4 protein n=1 Tax=Caulobacter sp. UNC279MFTsu5.1 TaxID=1502775 RepID=UPI0008F199CE|nr:glycosyltransferase family 4 protein [Caulobacter sp. UNC279MFTsu5.1]SFJ39943.1 Glycosyltransferase involved in cell wall bisynthesis [Caulobacter sp. UNC279MFTsu5.1]